MYRIPKKNEDLLTDREKDLLINDIKDVIGLIVGPEVVNQFPHFTASLAQYLPVNKLSNPLEEKKQIKILQGLIGRIKAHGTQQGTFEKENETLRNQLGDLVQSVNSSKRSDIVKLDQDMDYQKNIDGLKDVIMQLPTNNEGIKLTQEKKNELLGELENIAKDLCDDYIVDDIDFENLADIDIDALDLPNSKKQELKDIQKVIIEFKKDDGKINYDKLADLLSDAVNIEQKEKDDIDKKTAQMFELKDGLDAYISCLQYILLEVPRLNTNQMNVETKSNVNINLEAITDFLRSQTHDQRNKLLEDLIVAYMKNAPAVPKPDFSKMTKKERENEEKKKTLADIASKRLNQNAFDRTVLKESMSHRGIKNAKESSRHLVMAESARVMMTPPGGQIDNISLRKIISDMLDRAKLLLDATQMNNEGKDAHVDAPKEFVQEEKELADLEDLLMKIPSGNKQQLSKDDVEDMKNHLNKIIEEIKNDPSKQDDVKLLQDSLKLLDSKLPINNTGLAGKLSDVISNMKEVVYEDPNYNKYNYDKKESEKQVCRIEDLCMFLPTEQRALKDDEKKKYSEMVKRIVMNIRNDQREMDQIDAMEVLKWNVDCLDELPYPKLDALKKLQIVIGDLNSSSKTGVSNAKDVLSKVKSIFVELMELKPQNLDGDAQSELQNINQNKLRIEDLTAELVDESKRGNLTPEEKNRLKDKIIRIMMGVRNDPRDFEEISREDCKNWKTNMLNRLDPQEKKDIDQLIVLLIMIDNAAKRPSVADMNKMSELLGIVKNDLEEHSREISRISGVPFCDTSHVHEQVEAVKLEDIMMNIPVDGDPSKIDRKSMRNMKEGIKDVFMDLRGDTRNHNEVTSEDIIHLNIDDLDLDETIKLELKKLQEAERLLDSKNPEDWKT